MKGIPRSYTRHSKEGVYAGIRKGGERVDSDIGMAGGRGIELDLEMDMEMESESPELGGNLQNNLKGDVSKDGRRIFKR